MSVIVTIQTLNDQAAQLEGQAHQLAETARGLRANAAKLAVVFLGDSAATEVPQNAPSAPVAPAPKAPKTPEPTVAEIRAKAAKYGVNVDDVLPPGKKPTLQQKQEAAKKILAAKAAAEAAKAAAEAAQTSTSADSSVS